MNANIKAFDMLTQHNILLVSVCKHGKCHFAAVPYQLRSLFVCRSAEVITASQ